MRKLDTVFVHPSAAHKVYQELANDHSAIEPPIWAAMLANHCRSLGFGVSIIDTEADRLGATEAATLVVDMDPKLVCIVVYGQQPSASTQNMQGAVDLSTEIKKLNPELKILMVGPHVSAFPDEVLRDEPSVDFVCQNEGVYTISNLLLVKDKDNTEHLSKVDGLGFRSHGGVILNKISKIVSKKDMERDLPGMAWDLLPDIKKYRTAGWHSWSNNTEKEPFAAIYTSLGCPFRCSFCMINIINRTKQGPNIASADSNTFRFWSPEFMITQLDEIANMGVKNLKIADELFVLNPNHFLKLCNLIIERGYDFNIWAYSRIDTCKPKYLETLKKAGVNWLGLGIENPNTVLRKEIHKDGFKEIRINDVMDSMRDAGIGIGANYIFGLPMDTAESMQQTFDFAMSNLTDMVNFYCAMAYPGSPLHLTARKNGWALPDRYVGYSQHSYHTMNLPNDNLTSAEILKFRDDAWMKYHTNPTYLEFLEKKYGTPAKKNVIDTTKIKLKRKLLGD
jgi:anaerobic magnesium-protoporphyrin IX monomethyl ester cyclase